MKLSQWTNNEKKLSFTANYAHFLMNDCVLGLVSVSSAEASLSRREAGEEKLKRAGHDGEGKERSAFYFSIIAIFIGIPSGEASLWKKDWGNSEVGGGRGSAETIICLVHGIVLWRGYCSFLEPASRAKAEPRSNERTMGKGARNTEKAEKVFSFSSSPRQSFVLCHLVITPSTTPGNSPKWAIQYVCEIKVRIPYANHITHTRTAPPPLKSQMVGP